MGLSHGSNERVVFLDGSEKLIPIDPVRLGTEYNYKVVTVNQDVADAIAIPFTWRGGTVRPLSVIGVTGSRNTAGDLLIKWNRRSRIGAGLRPGSDVPLAEEREVYEIEVYDGSDVVDTWRVMFSGVGIEYPTWELIKDLKHLSAIDVDGSVSISSIGSGTGGEVLMISRQRVYADEAALISFDVKADFPATIPKNIGLLSEADIVEDLTGVLPEFGFARGSVGQVLTMEEFAFSASLDSGLNEVAHSRLTIRLVNNEVTYYQDRINESSPPYVSTTAVSGPASGAYRLYIREPTPTGGADVSNVQIERLGRMAVYTANQQITRFGSPQSSIKIRVYQVSAIVGRGAYFEAIL